MNVSDEVQEIMDAYGVSESTARKKLSRQKGEATRPKKSHLANKVEDENETGEKSANQLFFEAKLKNEQFKARLQEIAILEKEKQLISAEGVYDEGRQALKLISNELQQLADRISPLLAELPEREVNKLLDEEMQRLLQSFYDAFMRIGEGIESD